MEPHAEQWIETLTGIFEQVDEAGNRVYSRNEIRHFLPALMLGERRPGDPLSPETKHSLAHIASAARIPADATDDEITAVVTRYYAENPVNEQLARDVVNAIERDANERSVEHAERLRHFLGPTTNASFQPRTGPPPEGAVAAGPLARFRLRSE